jgi:hypothetical protein
MVGVDAVVPIPVTIPEASTVACAVLLLLHVPPAGVDASDVVSPIHTEGVPAIADGVGFTVTSDVVVHPVAVSVKAMVALPPDTPDTVEVKPGEVTFAMPVALLLHDPMPAPVSTVLEPAQTSRVPVIADGGAFTVTVFVAMLVQPKPLVTE